jgi:hypothetical protein
MTYRAIGEMTMERTLRDARGIVANCERATIYPRGL